MSQDPSRPPGYVIPGAFGRGARRRRFNGGDDVETVGESRRVDAMSRVGSMVGVILIVLGVAGYLATGMASVTALIPAFLGIVLFVAGWVGTRSERARTPALTVSVVVAALGFFGSLRGLGDFVTLVSGGSVERPVATVAQVLTALLCLGFLSFVVRWMIGRRRRTN